MSPTRAVLAGLLGTMVLLVWYVIVQFFPWGTGAVSNFSATTGESYTAGAPGLEETPPGTFTTDAFEDQLGGRISTLATDRSFSWIVSAPREHYDIPRYFAFHALTQAGIAACLVLALWILAPLSGARRLAVIMCVGAAGAIAVYGGMLNWMGMPAAYGVGESVNLLLGWVLAVSVMDRVALGRRSAQAASSLGVADRQTSS